MTEEFNLSEKIIRKGELWGEDFEFPEDMFWAKDVKTFTERIADKCFVIDGFSTEGKARIVVDIEDVKKLAGDDLVK